MIKRLFVSALLTGAALVAPAAASTPATAAVAAPAHTSATVAAHACTYRRDGRVWRCITPGAYCPSAARNRYGYAKTTGKRYKCLRYANGQWRWKHA